MSKQATFESVIMQLLHERGCDKTICPSEAARVMAELAGQPNNWRDWTESARATAIDMAIQGQIIIQQSGQKLDPNDIKGPIRLRLP